MRILTLGPLDDVVAHGSSPLASTAGGDQRPSVSDGWLASQRWKSVARDRRQRNGRGRSPLEPAHDGGAGLRVYRLDAPDLARPLLADVTRRERSRGRLPFASRLRGMCARTPLRPPRRCLPTTTGLRLRLHLLERHHVRTGALRLGVEYPSLSHNDLLSRLGDVARNVRIGRELVVVEVRGLVRGVLVEVG